VNKETEVYVLMELIWPKLIELRPLTNSDDADKFNCIQQTAERIWNAGYRPTDYSFQGGT
jgi:hypothetical protein